MITMSTLGSNGRLGNQLFQYAASIGLSKKHDLKLVLPPWPYAKYFEGEFPDGVAEKARLIQEPAFNYTPNLPIKQHDNVDLKGYFQSENYWKEAKQEVKKALTFKTEFKKEVLDKFVNRTGGATFNPMEKKTLAISVRRGDYVNNPSYAQLPITHYILAMFERFPDWRERSILVFSDDIPWCRVHFGCLSNVYFSENNNEIEDLCLLSQCHSFIISNSTFSWWGAYLAEMEHPVKVVRPAHHFDGRLLEQNDVRDYYPERWDVYNHKDEFEHNKKIDLTDCSFTIPVTYDHEDRNENLDLCLKVLRKNFDTEIQVMEQLGHEEVPTKFACLKDKVGAAFYYCPYFWRTQMLNRMAKKTDKLVVFNWDADVLIAPLQVWLTAETLRKGADFCFPYDGRFARIPRKPWMEKLKNFEDIGIVGDTQFNGMEPTAAVSVGGAIAFRRESFLAGGGENMKFIAYGAEDVERDERFTRLGYKKARVPGAMYHINHWIGTNSSTGNPHYEAGKAELAYVRSLGNEYLKDHVKTALIPALGTC